MKLSRSKKGLCDDAGFDDHDDCEESDLQSDEDESEMEEDVGPPAGRDVHIHESAIDLRGKRLDMGDVLQEVER